MSHGCRPGRKPHHALHKVRQGVLGSRIGPVIDGDISAFFDHGEHGTRLASLRKRVKDGRGLECIETWLKAGLLDGTALVCPEKGSPPGSVLSPVLANVYWHEVLDTWCASVVQECGRRRMTRVVCLSRRATPPYGNVRHRGTV